MKKSIFTLLLSVSVVPAQGSIETFFDTMLDSMNHMRDHMMGAMDELEARMRENSLANKKRYEGGMNVPVVFKMEEGEDGTMQVHVKADEIDGDAIDHTMMETRFGQKYVQIKVPHKDGMTALVVSRRSIACTTHMMYEQKNESGEGNNMCSTMSCQEMRNFPFMVDIKDIDMEFDENDGVFTVTLHKPKLKKSVRIKRKNCE